jgi:hypothetical protein
MIKNLHLCSKIARRDTSSSGQVAIIRLFMVAWSENQPQQWVNGRCTKRQRPYRRPDLGNNDKSPLLDSRRSRQVIYCAASAEDNFNQF